MVQLGTKNRKKKVKFKEEFTDIVLIENYRDLVDDDNTVMKDNEATDKKLPEAEKKNQMEEKYEEENNDIDEELSKKYNHKEYKENCSACCLVF